MSQESFDIKLYPLESEYVGRVELDDKVAHPNEDLVETIVIIDRSGSMRENAQRMLSVILPLAFSILGYSDGKEVHIIPFNDCSFLKTLTISSIKRAELRAKYGTFMSTAINVCHKNFERISNGKPVRLLTISDGDVEDVKRTSTAASEFAEYLKNGDFVINSQAVRFFTSDCQPDSTALASLLQVNNTTNPKLIDISSSETDGAIAAMIAGLFTDDKLDYHQVLQAKSKILLKTPWDSSPSDQILLKPGDNIFWLTEAPEEPMSIEDTTVESVLMPPLTFANFQVLMKEIRSQVTDQLKVLKVVGTTKAEEKIAKVVEYLYVRQ
jgi:hypothetical protein